MELNREASLNTCEDNDSLVNDVSIAGSSKTRDSEQLVNDDNIPINESGDSSEDDQKHSIPTTKKRRITHTTFSTTG